jgi:hypothetical protein
MTDISQEIQEVQKNINEGARTIVALLGVTTKRAEIINQLVETAGRYEPMIAAANNSAAILASANTTLTEQNESLQAQLEAAEAARLLAMMDDATDAEALATAQAEVAARAEENAALLANNQTLNINSSEAIAASEVARAETEAVKANFAEIEAAISADAEVLARAIEAAQAELVQRETAEVMPVEVVTETAEAEVVAENDPVT